AATRRTSSSRSGGTKPAATRSGAWEIIGGSFLGRALDLRRPACSAAHSRRTIHSRNRETPDAIWSVHNAVASAGAQPLRRPPVGPADAALGRRVRLQRSLDRRASYRPLGA